MLPCIVVTNNLRQICSHAGAQSRELGLTMPTHSTTSVSNPGGRRTLAVASGAALLLLSLGLAGDRMTSARAGVGLDLPQLMLWAWDRDDDLRFIDPADTGVAYLAATLTLRGEDVVLTARHNPLTLPPRRCAAVAVVHVETDHGVAPVQSSAQLGRFVEGDCRRRRRSSPSRPCRWITRLRHRSAHSDRCDRGAALAPAGRRHLGHRARLLVLQRELDRAGSMPTRSCRCCSA